MRTRNFNSRNGDRLFRVVPWFIGGVFVFVITMVVVQFAIVGWAGYHVLTDPEGTANFVGTIAGEAIRPVAEAIKGE